VAAKRLRFTTSNAEAAKHGDIILLAVGTPTAGSDGAPNLSYLLRAAGEIGEHLDGFTVIVNKSTVPVGTAERVARLIKEKTSEPFVVASNPEFLKEGAAVADFMRPDRVVIGTEDERAREMLHRLYAPFFRTSERILFMDARSAELTKYASNAYLAARVSFINDIANLCDAVGANVEHVRHGMGSDARIGNKFLFPGAGYGGSCFPKDTRALIRTAREYGLSMSIVAAAERINEIQKLVLVRKIRNYFEGEVAGRALCFWGLSFKPNTDDIREAPALTMVRALSSDGVRLRLHDPEAMENFATALGDVPESVEYFDDPYEAARGCDGLVLATEWRQFRSPDFERLSEVMRGKALFDGRNQWERELVEELGFFYTGIGK
jgi:UDPglucose 6-dehydrogenase